MRVFVCSLTLLLLIGIGSAAITQVPEKTEKESKRDAKSRVIIKYDRAKDVTTVRLKEFTITRLTDEQDAAPNIPLHQMALEVAIMFKGQQPAKSVDEVMLRFHSVAGNYVFLRPQQITAALDRNIEGQGRAFSLGTTEYKSTSPKFNTVFEEYLDVRIPSDAIVKIAKATSLELFVGPVGYRLTTDQHRSIQEIAGYLPVATSASENE